MSFRFLYFQDKIYKKTFPSLNMIKRGVLTILSLTSISLVSAAFYGGSGSFSLGEFLNSVDPSTLILGTLFLIFFAVLNYALGKWFKDKHGEPNKGVAGVVAVGISLIIIYAINKSGVDYENFVYDMGISPDAIWLITPWVVIAGIVLLFWKLKYQALLAISAILILIATLGNVVYEEGQLITVAIILLLVWAGIKFFTRKKAGHEYRISLEGA